MTKTCERYQARRRFAEMIRRRRRELDLTQEAVAGVLGVSKALVSAWERRSVLVPLRFIRTLETLYGYAPGDLLEAWAEANQERVGGCAK